MLCLNCSNASNEVITDDETLKADLELLKSIMSKRFKVVLFCKAKNSIVTGNPDKKTQSITDCNEFLGQ